MSNGIQVNEQGGIICTGPQAVEVYRMSVIMHSLRLYAKTGIKANRAYTPRAMMEAAAALTGEKFKARAYQAAADAIARRLKVEQHVEALQKAHPEVAVWAFKADDRRYLIFTPDARPKWITVHELPALLRERMAGGQKGAILEPDPGFFD